MENLKAGEKAILDKHEIVFVETLGVYASVIRHNNGDRIEVMNRRIKKLYTVRILDNGNARTVNPLGEDKWTHIEHLDASWADSPITDKKRQIWAWRKAESACVELPVKIESYDRIPVRNVNNLKSGIEFYAYRDNDTWILIEPKTE